MKQWFRRDVALLDLRGLRGRMSGCGDIPASLAKKNQPEASTLGHSYGLKRAIFSLQIPRLCKAGLGEVESFNYFSLRSSALQFLEGLPGVGPAADPLLFRQKWAKPVTPRLASCRGRTPVLGGRTNSLRSNKARQLMRASSRGPAGRRRTSGAISHLNPSFYLLSWCRVMSRVAGFRPGRRPTFVSAKVGKTSDAPPGRIGLIRREAGGDGLTRRARTSPPARRASDLGRAAGVGPAEQSQLLPRRSSCRVGVGVMFHVAGVRSGRRSHFLSANGHAEVSRGCRRC
ncbi:MAG: hypothetical protein H6750_16575 [Nitrospiraceae bacterium]|nr:hypothetical protein [Nitrospiraceae bacterium]